MEDQQSRVGLTDAVQAVRNELWAAIMAMVDEGSELIRFGPDSVELEFAIDFRRAADGRVQVLVLSADTDESAQPERIHRLRVTLERGPLLNSRYAFGPGYPGPGGLGGDFSGD